VQQELVDIDHGAAPPAADLGNDRFDRMVSGSIEGNAAITKIRSGPARTVINVYKLLLHSPAIAEVWLDLIMRCAGRSRSTAGYARSSSSASATSMAGSYVVNQHVPLHSAPEGLTQAECDALADWRASDLFGERERAALAFTDASTPRGRRSGRRVRGAAAAL